MKILVTGGAGFIGSEMVRQLAARGHRVTVVDNLATGKRQNLQDAGPGVELIEADIRDPRRIEHAIHGVDIVYHLACLGVRYSIHAPRETHEVNADASLQMLMAARDCNVTRFIYVSSSEVYGPARQVPMTEQHPTFPTTVYGASKLAGECYARAFHQTYGLPTVVVRPFNTFGPRCHHEGDSGEAIPKFLLRCMAGRPMIIFGDGKQTRNFTFVTDIARGIILAGESDAVVGQTINLGSGKEISMNELAAKIAAVAGAPHPKIEHIEPRPGDVDRLCADATLSRELLGFAPKIGLTEGLTILRDWYRALGQSPEELLESERIRNWLPPPLGETQ